MSTTTSIEWTEATWNPTTGCDRVSAGCDTSGPGFGVQTHEAALAEPLRWSRPRLVFVNSMSDLFHAQVPVEFIHRVFAVMAATPQHTYQVLTKRARRLRRLAPSLPWPSNLWIGTSIENEQVLHRLRALQQVPAAVRFLSCEPLLGSLPQLDLDGIGWLIAGGESGPHARNLRAEWVRDLRDQCHAAGVPFSFKQWGGSHPKAGGRELDGRTWDELPRR